MILQALNTYYERLAADPAAGVPLYGYSSEKVSWAIVLTTQGKLAGDGFHDLRQVPPHGKKPLPRQVTVPLRTKKSVNIAADFLWGDTGYVLGLDAKGKPERSRLTHEEFCKLQAEVVGEERDVGLRAVLAFLEWWTPELLDAHAHRAEIAGTNVVFRLDGEKRFVHEREQARDVWMRHFAASQQDATPAQCLVSGVNGPTARLHHAIKGVRGAQSSGANIVSFNKESFVSYEKEQGLNAPVGIRVAAAYVTALNYLLRRGSRQSVWVGDSSVVFWAERPCRLEESLYYMFNPSGGKEDDQGQLDMATSERVRVFLEALRQGRLRDVEPDIGAQFYMLGLAPNASRLSVRFWHQSTVGEFGERLRAHLADIAIEPLDEPPPAVWQILREVAVQGKAENVPPLLGGALMRSVLSGGKYPESLLAALLRRMHAEQGTARHARMAMIRGCLVRNHNQEVPMSLDSEKRDVPYLLGRLFAIFEKAQVDAMGGKEPNATIKDRYFGSASATPRAVFPVLFRLNQHHVSKGERGGYYTKLIGEVTEHLPAENLPTHMRLEEQGLFAIGYYHQRNAFFRKQDNN